MAPTKHSIFGASGSPRWIPCPASAHLQGEDCGNEHTDRGSAMHLVAEECLVYPDKHVEQYIDTHVDIDGRAVPFTRNMGQGVQFYLDFVNSTIDDYPNADLGVELHVSLKSYGDKYKDIGGTADVVLNDHFNDLVVIDLKGGKGVSVSAETPQIKMYAAMAADEFIDSYERIRCIIIQPFDMHGDTIKEVVYTPEEVKSWMLETVIPAIDDGMSDNPSFGPSETACRWCDHSGKCEAQAKKAFAVAAGEFESFMDMDLSKPIAENTDMSQISKDITNETMADILTWKPFIEDWLKAVKAEATNRMLLGEEIPGFKIVESVTKRRWKSGVDIENVLYKSLKFKKKDILETKIKSPTQMLKMAPKNRIEALEELIEKPKGSPTIAPESNKRKAMDPVKQAAQDFESLFG